VKEVELLFRINETRAQELRRELGKVFVQKVREIDTYFYPPHKDFEVSEKGRENLRVRENDSNKELTYKKVFYEKGEYSHSVEENLAIPDADKAVQLLKSLGFRVHFVIDKQREIFEEENYQITIDNVKGLGIFAEVEWTGSDGDEEEIRKSCARKAKSLGLDKIQDKGYLRLLEEAKD